MPNKLQVGVEYVSLLALAIVAISLTFSYVDSYRMWQELNYRYGIIMSQLDSAVKNVFVMNYPSRQTLNIYVPGYVNASRTFVSNRTINYGIITPTGTEDFFRTFDFCVKGRLPTEEGYYKINILSLGSCVVIDYNDIYVSPSSLNKSMQVGGVLNASFNIINLYSIPVNVSVKAEGDIASMADLNENESGRQTSVNITDLYEGGFRTLKVSFFGDDEGAFSGRLLFDNVSVPVHIYVYKHHYIPPRIFNTSAHPSDVYVGEKTCFNASVEKGSEEVDSVWVTLGEPKGCWSINGSCNEECRFGSVKKADYFNISGCNSTCNPLGTFYLASGSCDSGGSGSCYLMKSPVKRFASCSKQSSCGYVCEGSPSPCSSHSSSSCSLCGCSGLTSPSTMWKDDFFSSDDWEKWNRFGIDYVKDSRNCIDDSNGKCMKAGWGYSAYSIYKVSSIDLGQCASGTAIYHISHVKENGNLERDDCMYAAFSGDGGKTWGNDNIIFCGNLKGTEEYKIEIPDDFLTNSFKIRITKKGFNDWWSREEAYLDNMAVSCNLVKCTGTPSPCSSHSNASSCGACGCSWDEQWTWLLGDEEEGYESYEKCEWNKSGMVFKNITLYDSSPCSGGSGDWNYGREYEMDYEGDNLLQSGSVNDTLSAIATDEANKVIHVRSHKNVTVFFEDFYPTPYYRYNWTRRGRDWDSNDNSNCHSAGGCAHADGYCDERNDWIATRDNLINLSGAFGGFADLYVREDTSFDMGEYFRVWCYDGSRWLKIYEKNMGEWTHNGRYDHVSFKISPSCLISNARFKITSMSNNNNEDVFVDDFRVVKEI